jgi:hypothetical protein
MKGMKIFRILKTSKKCDDITENSSTKIFPTVAALLG